MSTSHEDSNKITKIINKRMVQGKTEYLVEMNNEKIW